MSASTPPSTSSTPSTPSRGAAVPPLPPPLYYVAGLVAGVLLQQLVALPVGGRPASTVAGVLLLAAGAVLTAGGVSGVVRHRTTIVPHRPVSALVVDGAYRWSRNPMYAGLALAYLGTALLLGSWWPVLLSPLVVLAVGRLVVAREEAYLADRFGDAYAAYRARVRRWL